MTRVVFPYPEDRLVIHSFLADNVNQGLLGDNVTHVEGNKLYVSGDVFMWYDTQGALWCQIGAGSPMHTQMRALNYVCELVGIPQRVIQQFDMQKDIRHNRLWFDAQEVGYNAPFVVLGALSMRAWREGSNL
jgi:hypothetical protein